MSDHVEPGQMQIVDTKKLSAGYYCLSVGKNADYKHVIKQIFIAK